MAHVSFGDRLSGRCALMFLSLSFALTNFPGCASSLPKSGPSSGSTENDGPRASATHTTPATTQPDFENDRKSVAADRESNPTIDRHGMLEAIMLLMDAPYAYNGSDSSGFDCSGFTSKIFADVLATTLPHSCRTQFALGHAVDRKNLSFGDLVFFDTGNESPSHVGIYVDDGLFAHASISNGVTLSLLADSYYATRFVGARRIVER